MCFLSLVEFFRLAEPQQQPFRSDFRETMRTFVPLRGGSCHCAGGVHAHRRERSKVEDLTCAVGFGLTRLFASDSECPSRLLRVRGSHASVSCVHVREAETSLAGGRLRRSDEHSRLHMRHDESERDRGLVLPFPFPLLLLSLFRHLSGVFICGLPSSVRDSAGFRYGVSRLLGP